MTITKKLTKQQSVCCDIYPEKDTIICYGFDIQGILSHIVGAISLYGVSIKSANSKEWEQEKERCFYSEFICSRIDVHTQIEIKKFIETQAQFIFANRQDFAKKIIVERIAEEVERHTEIVELAPIVHIDVKERVKNKQNYIDIEIEGKDHPFFLYMICDALAFHNLFILKLVANTQQNTIRDVFIVRQSKKATSQKLEKNDLHISLLLYIRFAYFIQRAPNPFQAIRRLQKIIMQIIRNGSVDIHQILDSNSIFSKEVVKVLGFGDYMWEDFVKTNVNEITKIFSKTQYRKRGIDISKYELELTKRLRNVLTYQEKIAVINVFKDEQRHLVDIDTLFIKNVNFVYLSKHLSELAKVVIRHALYLIEAELQKKYGKPLSAAGIESKWILFGLGKFGGEALGFASDLEVQLIYTDHGSTDGIESISNGKYFDTMLKELKRVVIAKKQGIFEFDFRLRPHGEEGPFTVQIDNFIEYYRLGGKAHSVERLALTRMRPIVGDAMLAEHILKLRDDFIYFSSSIDPSKIINMRQKQIDKEVKKGKRNAKFGEGTLLDVEICVQLLQIKYGKQYSELRQANIYTVLQNLHFIKDINKEDITQIQRAYEFFRILINALRIRRGNAKDVTLPPDDDWEATHIARRMNYKRKELSTKEQLYLDFDSYSAIVFRFVKNHIGKEAVRMKDLSPAALVYVEEEDIDKVSLLHVFSSPKTILVAIHNCTKLGVLHNEFAKILLLSWQQIIRSGNADGILILLSRLSDMFTVEKLQSLYTSMLHQPRRLFILLDIFSGSRYLSEEIIKQPSYIEEICKEEIAQKKKQYKEYMQELLSLVRETEDIRDFLNILRDYKKRQTLRIITQDICIAFPIEIIFSQLSDLAKSIVQTSFNYVCKKYNYNKQGIVIFAFGKLGAHELNYSSDLDLLCVYTNECTLEYDEILQYFKETVDILVEYTSSGRAYRVDLRLQPYGFNHEVSSLQQIEEYYMYHAKLWELQACIKLSCIAGDGKVANVILRKLHDIMQKRLKCIDSNTVFTEIHTLRKVAIAHNDLQDDVLEIKNSWGGLRDIEFIVQGLQLVNYQNMIPKSDTLSALLQLKEHALISSEQYVTLSRDYCYLRRIEHFLQVYDDKQLHKIPEHDKNFKRRLTWLLIGEQDIDLLIRSIYKVKERVKLWYSSVKDSMASGSR